MNVPKNIKRFWMWVGIALLVELAAFTLWKRWYWFFPTHAVSEVYTRYAGTDGLNVVFFKDLKINDSVYVDVTLIEAKTDSAWTILQSDFNIPKLDSTLLEFVVDKEKIVTSCIAAKHIPDNQFPLGNSVLLFSYHQKAVCVFHTINEKQQSEVLQYNLKKQYIGK